MAKIRQDSWSHEDDLLLAETVLRHIREGSTQLNAFEEVGDELNRTSAACGFRWNAEVRNKYIHAIDLAKRQRKERKRKQASQIRKGPSISIRTEVENENSLVMEPVEPIEITMDSVIQYLQSFQKDYHVSNQLRNKLEKIQYENNELREENSILERELSMTKKKLTTVEEDYKVFIEIMERARKMTVLDDKGTSKSPTFKMDKNGNLEQFAQESSN